MIHQNLCGKDIPRIGLGCMGMSEFYGQSDDENSVKLLSKAFELGYRHFDTADMYGRGHNEQLLSRFISGLNSVQRDQVVLASKVGIVRDPDIKYQFTVDNSRDYIRKSCDDSLKRLNVDYLDLYYLHRLAPESNLEEIIGTFSELIQEGKIKGIGLCEVSTEVLEKAHGFHNISAIQCEYSLWSRDVEASILPMCRTLNVPLVGFSPLGRGFLTGNVTKEVMASAKKEEDLRAILPRFSGQNLDNNMNLLDKYDQISKRENVSKSLLALAWLLAQSDLIHLIPGTRTMNYLESNFSSLDLTLSSEIITELSLLFQSEAISGNRYPGPIKP